MNDYYIGVDQNGQPYISHANPLQTAAASVRSAGAGLGRGVRRYHKYLMKIGEGTKARYLYTQQEVQAYLRGGRNNQNGTRSTASSNDAVPNRPVRFAAANSKRDTKAAADATKKALKEQAGAGKTAVKEIGDFAKVAAKSAVEDKADRIKAEIKKQKSKDTPENLYEQMYGVKPKKPHVTIVETDGSRFEKKVKDKLNSTKDRMKEEFQKKKDSATDKVKDKLGYDERERRDKAVKKYEQSIKDKERASDVRDRAFEEEFEKTTFSDPNIGSRDKIYRDPPMTSEERSEYDRAIQAADAADNYYKKMVEKETEAGKEARRAQDEYSKTILGQVDIAKKIAKDVQKATKEYSDSLRRQANNVKESSEDVIDTVISKTPAAKKKAKQAYESANETWEKAYDKAIKIQNERSELEYTSNGEKRSLTGNEYDRLIALRKEEAAAIDELRAATNKVHAAYHKAYGK